MGIYRSPFFCQESKKTIQSATYLSRKAVWTSLYFRKNAKNESGIKRFELSTKSSSGFSNQKSTLPEEPFGERSFSWTFFVFFFGLEVLNFVFLAQNLWCRPSVSRRTIREKSFFGQKRKNSGNWATLFRTSSRKFLRVCQSCDVYDQRSFFRQNFFLQESSVSDSFT